MNRRKFISSGILLSAGGVILGKIPVPVYAHHPERKGYKDLLARFSDPSPESHPFVRWWWNGNKVEKEELTRELRLLKDAGIGGVEINPIEFPSRQKGDDLGKRSLEWLSPEWISMLGHTFREARYLGLTCDLLVGSGWPFGREDLEPGERAAVMLLNATEINGPADYEVSKFKIFKDIDPSVTVPYSGRTPELVSLLLVPDPVSSLSDAINLDDKTRDDIIKIEVPEGRHFLYAMVRFDSFAAVINGAPGASGPILDHMNREAVRNYLDHMSDTISMQTGPLSNHIRAFFTDSMELEGCNWTGDFSRYFIEKRGYDIMPWLPYIMFRVGRLGGVADFNYGATKTTDFEEQVRRARFDFEITKAELLNERFTKTYQEWCSEQDVMSRAQSYGRGFFPLESSLGIDIPEGESWTTNWLKHDVGKEMPDDDYRRGRAYTMINKYVSSAAHLEGRRTISCEEMTNTYRVFNTSMELLKIGSDQSIMSGITHSIWHGFNYSPPEAPYPGWIQYGSYYNENNNWWPYFKYLNSYKARISSLLRQSEMYTDIAIMPANYDLWSELGVQTDPFPEKLNIPYTSLLWESINKNGGAADYITEMIIDSSDIRDGMICYGPKRYKYLILAGIAGINPSTLSRILDFIASGGNVICIDNYPDKSLGLKDYRENDRKVRYIVEKMKKYTGRLTLARNPGVNNSFLKWMEELMEDTGLPRYLKFSDPDNFLMQTRYQSDCGKEIIFFSNSNTGNHQETMVKFSDYITEGMHAWIWDAETGKRFRLDPENNGLYRLRLGPSESRIFVFEKNKNGKNWKELPWSGKKEHLIQGQWELEFDHCRNRKYDTIKLKELIDLKDLTAYSDFSGTITYRTVLMLDKPVISYINLGKVFEISELSVNGKPAGLRWYGYHIYDIKKLLKEGENNLEIKVITLMGNYMKSLEDNPNAQYWTNEGRKSQDMVSLGLLGPVRLY